MENPKELAILRCAEIFEELAEKYALPYLRRVLMGEEDCSQEVKLKAAIEVLNRHVGKPRESVDISGEMSLRIDC